MVVVGEATAQPQLATRVESWLREHGHEVARSPMAPESINHLIDCFLLNDETCAQQIVELRARSRSLVYTRVGFQPGTAPAEQSLELVGYWFEPGRELVAARRACEHCTPDELRAKTDDLLHALAKSMVASPPPLAADPVASSPAFGGLAPVAEGRGDAPDRRLAVGLLAGGALGLVAGTALVLTSQTDDGTRPEYRDTRAGGALLGTLGLAAVGAGAYLWYRGGRAASVPTMAIVPGGASVGWTQTF